VALDQTPRRLPEDHANARYLAEGLARIPGIQIDPAAVATNIVVFDVGATGVTGAEISARLMAQGVRINAINPRKMRAVTHYDVSREECGEALEILGKVLAR
jgi:threonine aldolase